MSCHQWRTEVVEVAVVSSDVETGGGRKPAAAAAVYTTANSHNCSGVMPDRV